MSNHPVWAVYDLLRTARLNVKYYSSVFIRYTQIRLFLEIALAFSASSAVAVALIYPDAPFGRATWLLLSCLAAIIAIVNPILNIGGKARIVEKLLNEYHTINFELIGLTNDIRTKNNYDGECKRRFQEILKRNAKIELGEPILRLNEKLLKRKQNEVLREMPVATFFVPEEEEGN